MIKLLRLVLVIVMSGTVCKNASSQSLGVNTTGAAADNSAILDVSSTDKGMLVPRMSKAQKNAIATPATGLLVFQDSPDSTGFHYYDGTQWSWLANSNKLDTTAWLTTGNTGMNDTSFIGHRDNKPINFRISNIKYGRFDRSRYNYFIGRAAGHDNGVGHIAIGDSAGVNTNNNYPGVYLGYRAGNLNTGTNNAFLGAWSGQGNTTGSGNVFVGTSSGINNTTGYSNAFIGHFSGYNSTIGINNTALGAESMANVAGGSNNVAIGTEALSAYQGSNVVAVGFFALDSLTTGTRATAVGYRALAQNTSGDRNTAIGYRALDSNKIGHNNVALGYGSLFRNQSSYNSAVGENSLLNNVNGYGNTSMGAESMVNSKDGWYNVAFGFQALAQNDSGSNNVAVGVNALFNHKRPFSSYNTAIGNYSMESDTAGYYNTGVGISSLRSNIDGIANTGLGTNAMYFHKYNDYNTAVGYESMFYDTSGASNTAMGWRSLRYNKAGIENTAIGVGAIEFTDSSARNTAIGRGAMIGVVGTKGVSDNVVIGWFAGGGGDSVKRSVVIGAEAGYNNQGYENTFVGFRSGNGYLGDITGIENTGVGAYTLVYSTTGRTNTALGIAALHGNQTGSNNTAIGARSMLNGISSSNNVAVGDSTLVFSTANNNTSIGHFSMRFNTSGVDNVALGMNTLAANNDGNRNIAIGKDAGGGMSSSDNTTLLGYAATAPGSLINATALGSNSYVTQNNSMVLGSINGVNGATVTTSVGIGTTAPAGRLHVRRSGSSGGPFVSNASLIVEDNVQSYVQLSNPTGVENGIVSGNTTLNIRAGLIFAADNSLFLRAGGNTTRMTVDNTGFVGIGTTAPAVKLHLHETTAADISMRVSTLNSTFDPALELLKTGAGGADWKIAVNTGNLLTISRGLDDFATTPVDYYEYGVTSFRPSTDATNSLGLSGNKWSTVYAANGVINTSDAREKENIQNLHYGLTEILKLRPVEYTWKQNPQWGKKLGFLAQEIQPVLKEVVQVGDIKDKDEKTNEADRGHTNDKLGIYYSDIIPVAVKAIQEQQTMIESQARENAELKKKNEQLENDIRIIKEKLGIKN